MHNQAPIERSTECEEIPALTSMPQGSTVSGRRIRKRVSLIKINLWAQEESTKSTVFSCHPQVQVKARSTKEKDI